MNYMEKGTDLWGGHIKTRLDNLYLKKVEFFPDKVISTDFVWEAIASLAYKVALQNEKEGPNAPKRDDLLVDRIEEFLAKKPFVVDKIRERANRTSGEIYRRSSILLAYFAISEAPVQAKALLPDQQLNAVYVDLGISPDRGGR